MVPLHKAGISCIYTHVYIFRHLKAGISCIFTHVYTFGHWNKVRWGHMVPLHKVGMSCIYTHVYIFRHLESGQMGSYGTFAQSWNILYVYTQLYLQTSGVRSDGVIWYPCTKLKYPVSLHMSISSDTWSQVRWSHTVPLHKAGISCIFTHVYIFRHLESGQMESYGTHAQSWNIQYLYTQLYLQTPGVRSDRVIWYPCTKLEYPVSLHTAISSDTWSQVRWGHTLPLHKAGISVFLHTAISSDIWSQGRWGHAVPLHKVGMSCIFTHIHNIIQISGVRSDRVILRPCTKLDVLYLYI